MTTYKVKYMSHDEHVVIQTQHYGPGFPHPWSVRVNRVSPLPRTWTWDELAWLMGVIHGTNSRHSCGPPTLWKYLVGFDDFLIFWAPNKHTNHQDQNMMPRSRLGVIHGYIIPMYIFRSKSVQSHIRWSCTPSLRFISINPGATPHLRFKPAPQSTPNE
jgi:hypothetical protein